MLELTTKQRLMLLDLIEHVIDRDPLVETYLNDPQVIYRFLYLSKDAPETVHDFLSLISPLQWSALTEQDVLTEEVMLELHLMIGFSDHDLSQWLKGLSYGAVQFFKGIAAEKEVLMLDQIIFKSRFNVHLIDGVRIDELPKYFDSLDKLLEYVLKKRITYKQYRNILAQLPLEPDEVLAGVNELIQSHGALVKITRSSQLLAFRVFCALFDFLESKDRYITGVCQVMDQLLNSSSTQQTLHLINSMPYPIIEYLIERYIRQDQREVMAHLNESLPNFMYGTIRKIVRRRSLGVNYKHD